MAHRSNRASSMVLRLPPACTKWLRWIATSPASAAAAAVGATPLKCRGRAASSSEMEAMVVGGGLRGPGRMAEVFRWRGCGGGWWQGGRQHECRGACRDVGLLDLLL